MTLHCAFRPLQAQEISFCKTCARSTPSRAVNPRIANFTLSTNEPPVRKRIRRSVGIARHSRNTEPRREVAKRELRLYLAECRQSSLCGRRPQSLHREYGCEVRIDAVQRHPVQRHEL